MEIGIIELLMILPVLLLLIAAWSFRLGRFAQKKRQLHQMTASAEARPRRPILGINEPDEDEPPNSASPQPTTTNNQSKEGSN